YYKETETETEAELDYLFRVFLRQLNRLRELPASYQTSSAPGVDSWPPKYELTLLSGMFQFYDLRRQNWQNHVEEVVVVRVQGEIYLLGLLNQILREDNKIEGGELFGIRVPQDETSVEVREVMSWLERQATSNGPKKSAGSNKRMKPRS